MQNNGNTDRFTSFVLLLVTILVIVLVAYVCMAVYGDQKLSTGEQGFMAAGLGLFLLGLGYVIKQRLEMRKHETFRKEKW